ncbi:hypothetical protein [Actinoallomurus iriomotensis]|uniref:Uncharacterized protein n=1 Tax=Actinoallomurus iriomotensis TaxID=478107 RepID=A0A9W6RWW4_9ACTN|nr:hypothetical protein [Actinoallomurus iriomotensis]GLY84206.1 hypothetical protein Airi02_021350 [Actinoallomurus iriomotensis]
MLRRDRADGIRFLAGLTVGGMVSGLLLSLVVVLLGGLAHAALPEQARVALLAGVCAILGIADLADRTPHPWRQVPQKLIHRLSPGMRGVTWGVDLGLLVTTQKVASLVWATIAAMVLLDPLAAPPLLVAMAIVSCLSVAVVSGQRIPFVVSNHGRDRRWLRLIRASAGATLLLIAVINVLQT